MESVTRQSEKNHFKGELKAGKIQQMRYIPVYGAWEKIPFKNLHDTVCIIGQKL